MAAIPSHMVILCTNRDRNDKTTPIVRQRGTPVRPHFRGDGPVPPRSVLPRATDRKPVSPHRGTPLHWG
jgi:hypothetical protein